jgi:hypothetical protein
MNDKNNLLRIALMVCLCGPAAAGAASWHVAAGATPEQGGAFEVARRARDWEVALGYVTEQRVLIHYLSTSCPYAGAPRAACSPSVRDVDEPVDPFAYLSVQRRFEFRRDARLRPVLGVGLVGQSDTNEFVSTRLNFSLSLGLGLGEDVAVEWRHFSNAGADGHNLGQDAVLLRWRF